MKIPKRYRKLIERLTKACEVLKWDFSTDTDAVSRMGIDDGVAFTIDRIEYLVSVSMSKGLKQTTDRPRKLYYASVMVQYHGSRHEPPSEDEVVLKGDDVIYPESLVLRLLDTHWQVRRQWAMEAIIPEEQG